MEADLPNELVGRFDGCLYLKGYPRGDFFFAAGRPARAQFWMGGWDQFPIPQEQRRFAEAGRRSTQGQSLNQGALAHFMAIAGGNN